MDRSRAISQSLALVAMVQIVVTGTLLPTTPDKVAVPVATLDVNAAAGATRIRGQQRGRRDKLAARVKGAESQEGPA